MSSKTKQDLLAGIGIYAALLATFLMTTSMLPDSALFPRLILFCFVALNTIMIIQAFLKKGETAFNWNQMKMPLLYFVGIILYAGLFAVTGYFPSTAIMLVAYMVVLKVRPYWMIAAVTAGYMGFIYLLFVVWLKVNLL